MSPRAVFLVGLLAPACYTGAGGDPQDSESTASTASSATSAGPADPSGEPAETGQPTDGPGSETGQVTVTSPGTTDMSEGPGSDPGTSGPGPDETTGPGPGTSTTGEPGTTDDTGDPPPDAAAMLCARWNGDRADLGEGTWDGAINGCNKGSVSQDGRDNALRQVNLYRWIAGLPAVAEDPARTGQAQACALMMHANGALDHDPPVDWKCYTAEGAAAASKSNISGGPGVFSVDLYMIDVGNETTMGHRRWILSNSLGGIGLGSTSQNSCLMVIGGDGNAGEPWMAWPPPGLVPLQAMYVDTVGWSNVDAAGWSIQSDGIDLAGAKVSVTEGGVDRPVTVNVLGPNFGSSSAIRFVPQGWKAEAGKTYDVAVGGVNPAIAYSVTIVDCG